MEFLITIKQPCVDYIFLHRKIYEVRKVIPKKLCLGDVIYFCVKGNGNMVVGCFDVGGIISTSAKKVKDCYLSDTMIRVCDLIRYMGNPYIEDIGRILNRKVYLIIINCVRNVKPFHVSLLGLKSAPQGFVKIDSSKIKRK